MTATAALLACAVCWQTEWPDTSASTIGGGGREPGTALVDPSEIHLRPSDLSEEITPSLGESVARLRERLDQPPLRNLLLIGGIALIFVLAYADLLRRKRQTDKDNRVGLTVFNAYRGMALYDRKLRHIILNRAMRSLLRSAGCARDANLRDLYIAAARNGFLGAGSAEGLADSRIEALFLGPLPATDEFELLPDRWLQVQRVRLEPLGTALVVLDETESRAADRALREGESRYRQLIESAPSGIFALDADNKIVAANERLWRILDWNPLPVGAGLESLPSSLFEQKAICEGFARTTTDRAAHGCEINYRTPAGEDKALGIRFAPFEIDGRMGVQAVVDDATERHSQRKSLEHRLAFYELMSGIAMSFVGERSRELESDVEAALERASELIGADRALLGIVLGSPPELQHSYDWCRPGLESHSIMFDPVTESKRATWMAAHTLGKESLAIQRTDEIPPEAEYERRAFADRGVRSALTVPVRSERGVTGFVLFEYYLDYGNWTDQDVQLIEVFAEILALGVKGATASRELNASRDRLRDAQKMEAVGQLAAGLAHDFGNFLMVVSRAEASLAEGGDPGRLGDDHRRIKQAVAQASDLIGSLLTLGRGSSSRPGCLEVSTFLREVEPLLRGALPSSIDLEIGSSCDGPLTIWADRTQLSQVLVNLAINARDAMGDIGRLQVRASLRRGAKARCILEVIDSGPGIPPALQSRVFEPFFTTKSRNSGTGLGLSVTHRIVSDHGGEISLQSTPTSGTTFRISLPVHERAPTPQPWPVEGRATGPSETGDAPAAN